VAYVLPIFEIKEMERAKTEWREVRRSVERVFEA